MFANDIKKGAKMVLTNGWKADMADNAKGIVRMAKVYGFETEIGSIYMHDVARVQTPAGHWELVEFTPTQQKNIATTKSFLAKL